MRNLYHPRAGAGGGRVRHVELFAGAGGLSRGTEAAGFICAAHAEAEDGTDFDLAGGGANSGGRMIRDRRVTALEERPIIFSAPSVRAILDGTKTQTRRVVKDFPHFCDLQSSAEAGATLCPFGTVGQTLWVRETWGYAPGTLPDEREVLYFATPEVHPPGWTWPERRGEILDYTVKRPSIFMPRWASRITLEITRVRVDRLQDISEEDAIAEGCHHSEGAPTQELSGTSRGAYAVLWDDINAKRAPWSSNPWVWVIEFARDAA